MKRSNESTSLSSMTQSPETQAPLILPDVTLAMSNALAPESTHAAAAAAFIKSKGPYITRYEREIKTLSWRKNES